jgi:hypothetical protein
MTVDLICGFECPHSDDARAVLRLALAATGLPPAWREWTEGAPNLPVYARGFGSPTILVDGHDVSGAEPTGEAPCCRVYPGSGSRDQGVPALETVMEALRAAAARQQRSDATD